MTLARLYVRDTILERLAQHLQDVAAELRQFIQKEHAVVRRRHLARQRHVAAADQPHI
jgi:RecJ-like exonuclease